MADAAGGPAGLQRAWSQRGVFQAALWGLEGWAAAGTALGEGRSARGSAPALVLPRHCSFGASRHRLLHHALSPLEQTLGQAPYARKLYAASSRAAAAEPGAEPKPQMVHVQRTNVATSPQTRGWRQMRAFA